MTVSFDALADDPKDRPQWRVKHRWRRRTAWRDGLAAETVIAGLENAKVYRAFERAIVDSYSPQTALELALLQQIAHLLWRLRRAGAIETGLFALHSRTGSESKQTSAAYNRVSERLVALQSQSWPVRKRRITPQHQYNDRSYVASQLAESFLQLSRADVLALDRVGVLQLRIWRQVAQIIAVLEAMRTPQPSPRSAIFRRSVTTRFGPRMIDP
jgi:hypothetical protein